MPIEVHILGTSSARPAQGRSVSGSIVETGDGSLVIDCGEGFQNRLVTHRSALKKSEGRKIKVGKIAGILLTHGHLDHTWGVLPWLQTMALDGRKEKLYVIGPTTSKVIDVLLGEEGEPEVSPSDLIIQYDMWMDLGATTEDLGYEVKWILSDGSRWIDMNSGDQITMPQPLNKSQITAINTQHTIPSFAWKIETKSKKGKFDRVSAAKLPQEVVMKLANGENVEYNGETLFSKNYRGPDIEPVSVIISGDTAEQAIDSTCDLLIHEATFLQEHADVANEHLHSTAAGAARTANECKAKHLALTHFSARLENGEQSFAEASKIHHSVVTLSDGDRLILHDDFSLQHLKKIDDDWIDST